MKKIVKSIIASLTMLVILLIVIFIFPKKLEKDKISLQELITPASETVTEPEPVIDKKDNPPAEIVIPLQKSLPVPFISQAPLGNWDQLHEDACEEASILMLDLFYDGTKSMTKDEAEKELHALTDYEKSHDYNNSMTLEELNTLAVKYFKMTSGKVMPVNSINDIKKEIAGGNPVIIPAAGKVLPNPYFKNGGPVYHMLVIKGYDETHVLSNDPGTVTKGEGLKYTYADLLKSIHDWNPTNILNGQKAMLVFEK